MGLLEFLKREESARLIFGKRDLQIIRKQLMGEQLKQSERNRLSKFIRPKLRFIKSCANFQGEFELKRSSVLKELVQNTKQVVLKDKLGRKIIAILLYKNTDDQNAASAKIYICAMFKEIEKADAEKFIIRVMRSAPPIVDIKVFNTLPIWIKHHLVKDYEVLFKRKGFDEDFWIYVIKEASESRVMKWRAEKKTLKL